MKRVVYTNSGSTLATVIIPVDPNASDASMLALVPPDATNVHVCNHTDIPEDRTFRNAWTKVAGQPVVVDMPKARDIQREIIRTARAPELQALDVAFMIALEAGDKAAQAEIALRKQALRDATKDPRIESAATPDELKDVMPIVGAEIKG